MKTIKTIIAIALIMLAISTTQAQTVSQTVVNDSIAKRAMLESGKELIKATANFQTGMILGVVGGAAITWGVLPPNHPKYDNNGRVVLDNSTKTFKSAAQLSGAFLLILGIFCEVDAWTHIKNAGISLDENGLGMKIILK